ncbi:MAG: flavohemoglobin expression-modulating QEGLA motif protein [Gammaproteobacteria bacterium CG11_big_fil_rev_8_21_14_0_20_46_22]|nr:MAG: flavohemoglobin expression-modulating QEGLA motif protein [Gammaproteobacteria bacterium CG12_big_fil_rev_8_21_14_0_65_46_12]PIR12062.1 MAG: flavohemoglobin expression-modulating QEGLA motif protein [Gammaproteobacteria bacterium CG11_big_fil_rev_8_21_14_0_20_46_22]
MLRKAKTTTKSTIKQIKTSLPKPIKKIPIDGVRINGKLLTKEQKIIRKLSDRIVRAQRPIRILEAIRWEDDVRRTFFKSKFKKLPKVNAAYYKKKKIAYNFDEKIGEFEHIEAKIRSQLGQFCSASRMMQAMCQEYVSVLKMLKSRGTPDFGLYSSHLYGSTSDALYAGAPKLRDIAANIAETLENIAGQAKNKRDDKRYSAKEAAAIMQTKLRHYFHAHEHRIKVSASSDIVADAAAGAEQIKMNSKVRFSDRNIRQLEVHEGWVHLGTTLNGLEQPICTFLSKGTPSATITQEGLAIIVEVLSLSCYPSRVARINNRVIATDMAQNGADFIEVFNYFMEHAHDEHEAYNNTARIFRGSTANGKPFTKDLAYTKGFISIYNFLRLAFQKGQFDIIPMLFAGKTTLENLNTIVDMHEDGLVIAPRYVPPQFTDPAALAAWAAYSTSLSSLSMRKMEGDFKSLLRE